MKKQNRERRKKRIRSSVKGTSERPRISVYRSNKYIYAQVIDDTKGITLTGASGKNPTEVGEAVAKETIKKKIKKVVFDRSGYKYHGKVRKLAEAARKGGLEF